MPGASTVHIDAAMTQISVKFTNPELIGGRLFPSVPVKKQSDRYYIIGKEAYRLQNDTRRPGSRAKVVDWTLANAPYYCDGHALEYDVPDEVRENSDPAIQADIDGTEFTTNLILLNKEKDIADKVRDSSAYPVGNVLTLSGTSQWSDFGGSNPITDIRDLHQAVFEGTWGRKANVLVLPYAVHLLLKDHPAIIERIKYSERGVVTDELLKELFEVEEILHGDALYDSAAPGGTASQSYIWGKDVLLAYRPKAAGLRQVSLGYTFQWGKQGTEGGVIVTRWREEARKTDCLMVENYYDNRLIVAGAGALIKDAVA